MNKETKQYRIWYSEKKYSTKQCLVIEESTGVKAIKKAKELFPNYTFSKPILVSK